MAKANNLSTGKPVGTVKGLIGNATATDANGVTRALQIGDKVYANDIINASAAGGTIHIEFTNNSFATLGGGQTLILDNSLFAAVEEKAPQLDEAALQAQIAAGLDPTLVAEAAAAGATGGGGDQGGHQFVVVEQNAARGEVTAGFETSESGNVLAGSTMSASDVWGSLPESGNSDGTNSGGTDPGVTGPGDNNSGGTDPGGVGPGDNNLGGTAPGGTDPGPTEPEGETYNARAVMYTAESGVANSVTLTGLKAGSDVPIWKDESVKDYFNVTLAGDGTVTIILNAAGQAALLSGDLDPYSYLEIVGSDGKTYVVQVILSQDNSFNSGAEDRDTTHGASLASGGLVHGEWHSGQDFSHGGSEDSSGLGDQISFSGSMRADGDNNTINSHTNKESHATIGIGSTTTDSAMLAMNQGSNHIIGGAGLTDVTLKGGIGMNASGTGAQNQVSDVTSVTINATDKGLNANAGGNNSISHVIGDIKINSSTTGLSATNGSNSIHDVNGNVTVNGGQYGLNTDGLTSSNSISKVTGNVSVSADLSGMGGHRTTGGTNSISDVNGNVSITTGTKGIGMNAWYTNQNSISNVQGSVNMTASTGMYAFGNNTKNSIDNVGGDLNIKSAGQAMYTGSASSENSISNVKGNVTFTVSNSGIYSMLSYGKNTISNVGGNVTIGGSTGPGVGMFALGKNTISNVGGSVIVTGQVGVDNKGINLIEKVQKDVSVSGGLSVQSNGVANTIQDVGGNVTIQTGMSASAGQNSIIGVGGAVLVNNANAYVAMSTSGIGKNVINAVGNVTVSVNNSSNTASSLRASGGSNSITSENTVVITAQGKNNAYGLFAENGGKNILVAKDVSIASKSSSADAYGVYATGTGSASNLLTAGGSIDIDVQSKTTAYGLNASNSGSNVINAGGLVNIPATTTGGVAQEVNLKVSSVTGDAHGMSVMSTASKNTITADKVSIETKSTEGNAYAMKASDGGVNTIQAGAGSAGIEVRIAVEAGKGKDAYAMYAKGAGAVNTIMGTAGNDTISLKGDIKAESGGKNIINTGGGTNTIDLEGTISKGSLTLQTDVGGKDILILRADNAADFQAKYQTWLNEVKTSGINIIGVDVVIGGDVTGSNVNASDFAWLEGLFGQDTVHYGVHDYTEAAPMMAAFADSLDDYTDVSASHADTNDQSVNMGSESQPDMATVPLMENTENISVETSALDSTTLDITEAALAGEVVLETAQDSAHHILLADNISLPEGITYDSLVDGEGHINLDAIHTVKELLTSQEHYELHAGDSGDILFGSAGDDILIGGAGDDVLVSGTGQTTFVYEQGDLDHVTSGDKIVDFKLGEDVLDISDLLSGADKPGSVSDLFSNGFLNFDKISQNEDGTTTIKLSIDTDGSAGHASDYVPLAEMTVYGLNLGSDPTANDVLEQLVNNGSIQF